MWRPGLIAWLYDRIIIHLEVRRQPVPCPQCGVKSSRVHSRYRRRASDLPWSSWPVQLVIHTRKFLCDNLRCLRRIFTETFLEVVAPYARRTQRLGQALLELVHASNAESAVRVGGFLGYPTRPNTLLRCLRQEPISVATPRVLGVDEYALRRGCAYATFLVDLERLRPVDIPEGKQAQPLTQWLRDHPGANILTRDRAEAYALAGRTGAAAARQVADRFHLVHNVSEARPWPTRSPRGTWRTLAEVVHRLQCRSRSCQSLLGGVPPSVRESVHEPLSLFGQDPMLPQSLVTYPKSCRRCKLR